VLLVVSANLMLAAVVPVVVEGTMEREVVKELEVDRLAATTLPEAALVDTVAAMVAALLKVSLKVLVLELGVVPAQELDGPVAVALLVQAMLLDSVPAMVVAREVAIMAGQAAVEAPDLDPVTEDTIKFSFVSDKLEQEPTRLFNLLV